MPETRYLYHIAFDIVFRCLKDGKTMAVVFWSSWMCYQWQRTAKRTGHMYGEVAMWSHEPDMYRQSGLHEILS